MIINLNELKQYDSISLNMGNGLIIDLKMSNDKQSVDISLNKSNETLCSCPDVVKTEGNNNKQIDTKDLLSNKEYQNFIKNLVVCMNYLLLDKMAQEQGMDSFAQIKNCMLDSEENYANVIFDLEKYIKKHQVKKTYTLYRNFAPKHFKALRGFCFDSLRN